MYTNFSVTFAIDDVSGAGVRGAAVARATGAAATARWALLVGLGVAGLVGCDSAGEAYSGAFSDTTPPAACQYSEPTGPVYYVATDGSDEGGDGAVERPWASISHALGQVPDGSTILVAPGTYRGVVRLSGHFDDIGVVIRSQALYRARLRPGAGDDDRMVYCYDCSGITLEGFDIAHAGSGTAPLVVHIQDQAWDVIVRNNILHDSYNNDILKINNGAHDITVERNLFFNQQGTDEHIDINSVSDVIVQDNIFLNDFAGSGRSNGNDTSSYIVIKDSNDGDDGYLGAERITVRRNAFLHWEGGPGHVFVLLGEDGKSYIEAREVLIENNLFIGDSDNPMRAVFGIKSASDVTFRNNTVVGDFPGRAFAMRLNVENDAVRNRDVRFYNNIWSDPSGTMERFSESPLGQTDSFAIDNNLYWNNGAQIPERDDDLINVSGDGGALLADPRLRAPTAVVLPSWDASGERMRDGSNSTCAAFTALVMEYGMPGAGSAAIDSARADQAPLFDILGKPRGSAPDIGAVEAE